MLSSPWLLLFFKFFTAVIISFSVKGTFISLFGGRRVSSDCGQPQSDSVGLCPELGPSFNDLNIHTSHLKGPCVLSFYLRNL